MHLQAINMKGRNTINSTLAVMLVIFLMSSTACIAQSKKTVQVLANAKLLQNTVFGTKDSATLDKLFGKTLAYQHSGGKIENREEALHNISHNKSEYKNAVTPISYSAKQAGDSIIVTHVYQATEAKVDGKETELNLTIETVWLKEGKDWKLYRRRATKNH